MGIKVNTNVVVKSLHNTISMKKILCLIDTLGYGGAERQMMGLVTLLKESGYDVDLVTYIEHNLHTVVQERCGMESITLIAGKSMLSKLLAVRKYVEKKKYDVVIAYKDGATSLACIIKMIGGRYKLIVSERNTTQRLDLRTRIKFGLYRFAQYVVPNSHSQEKYIRAHFPWLISKVFTITNYTDLDTFYPLKNEHTENIEVLTVARISPQKNVLNFIDAVRLVKERGVDVHFKWYGDVRPGTEDYAMKCMERVKAYGLEDVITFHPATKNIVQEYQKCDIFCLPSLYEGYPNVICEAMSCGKPVLCGNVCDNPFIVDETNSIVFNPIDCNDIANGITKMIQKDFSERCAMGERSRVMAEGKFSKESFIGKYIQLIES